MRNSAAILLVLLLAGSFACINPETERGGPPVPAGARAGSEPNLLFLFADDQRADTIGAWGNPHIRTPHLDEIAARGFSLQGVYCHGSIHGAVCVPSRAMVLTGRSLYRVPMNLQGVETVPEILDFVREGGAAIAIGSSANLAYHAGLPVQNHLTENGRELTREEYFTPGSVLDMKVEHRSPLTHGFGDRANVLFSHSPTFALEPGAEARGVRRIGWFDTPNPLRSGWAWGERYLENGVGAIEADYGQGKMFIFGPKITFRSQPHGTFGFLFNGIYYGASKDRPIS